MTQETLTAFFGWMTVLNFAFLTVSTLMIVALRDWMAGFHGRMFDMDPSEVRKAYFRYLAHYKVLTFIFCLMPWLALKMV